MIDSTSHERIEAPIQTRPHPINTQCISPSYSSNEVLLLGYPITYSSTSFTEPMKCFHCSAFPPIKKQLIVGPITYSLTSRTGPMKCFHCSAFPHPSSKQLTSRPIAYTLTSRTGPMKCFHCSAFPHPSSKQPIGRTIPVY